MPGAKTFILSSLLLCPALTLSAATPDLFPLHTGNSWLYRGAARSFNAQPGTINVEGTERFRDVEYFRVEFLGNRVHLRQSGSTIYAFDTTAGTENVWLQFDAPIGQSVPVEFDQCTRAARIESTEAKVTTPAGEWTNALHFTFQQSCADAGFTAMYFVPGFGPVAYEQSSIAGPVRYELTYVRAGSSTANAPETAFTVALNRAVYEAAEAITMQVRLTLRSTDPVILTFPSGQQFDLRLWNDKGEIVYTWSADKLFPQVISQVQVGPGEKTFGFNADVPNLAPGRYVAEAWIATQSREYVGTVGAEVRRPDPLP